jgi:nucleoside-diphosphate-sugar epimerase
MNITIIGGSGFVGTHLIDLLKQSSRDQLINIDKVQSEKYSVISKIGNVLDKQLLYISVAGYGYSNFAGCGT